MQQVALRKRQAIALANRRMFLWVAGVSAITGISMVLAFTFLMPKILFNQKVLAEKGTTAQTLKNNNAAVQDLNKNIQVLNTNQNLIDSLANKDDDQPVQAILDALPAEANSSALGSSLQKKFLSADGITIESLNVDPVSGIESNSEASSSTSSAGDNTISFRFAVTVPKDKQETLGALLGSMERSIRVIDITSIKIESQGTKLLMSVSGHAFYEPAQTVELKTKTVKP